MELKSQPKLYSTETGEVIKADPAKISELVSSGKAAFKRGEIIPVVDSNGSVSGVPAEDFTNALSQGFQYEPLESQQKRAQEQEYGDQPIRAGVEAAARGLSLGLSDVALRGLGADAEGLAGRKEFNPVVSTGLEVGGAIAPVLLSGGSGLAAKGGLTAAARMTPAALAARAGTAAMGATEAAIGSGAAKSLAGKIAKSAIPMAAGSAVEGAIYSAGNVLSEAALGDPDINAEKAIAQIGMGAALGGALGGLVGTVAAPFGKKSAAFVSELDDGAKLNHSQIIDKGFDTGILKEEQKEGLIAGLTKIKKNAPEIRAAADELGAPVLESQISASPLVQDGDRILMQNYSPTGMARKELAIKGVQKAEQAVDNSLGASFGMTKAEVGNEIKKSLTSKFQAESKPISAMYDQLKKSTDFIPVDETLKKSFGEEIRAKTGKFFSGVDRKIGEAILKDLPNIKTVDDVKRFNTQLYSDFPLNRKDVARISEGLLGLEEKSVINAAEKFALETGDIEAKQSILSLIDQRGAANKSYKEMREKMGELGEVLGKKRISGPADFMDFIDDLTPEKVAEKIFTKKDSEFLTFMQKKFPEELELSKNLKKQEIRESALKDGVLNVNTALRKIDDLEPEVQRILFNQAELKQINAARVYMESMPPVIRSETSKVMAALDFFGDPKGAIYGSIRDKGIEKFIKSATSNGMDGNVLGALMGIEKAAQKVTKELSSTVKAFLTKAAPVGTYLGVKAFVPSKQEERGNKQKEFEKQQKEVTEAISNPEAMADKISASFSGLGKFAPKMAEAATYKATMAVSFLYEKMPKNPMAQENIFSNKQWKPSDFEVSKWMKYVNTVEDPMSAFKDLKKGRMSMEQAETLKTIYPQLYGEATRMFMEELPKLKEELPYQKRVQLGVLFDLPTDPSLKPEFVAQMQLSHAQATQQEAQKQQSQNGVSASRADKLNFSEKAMTNTQRVITRS